MQTCAQSPPADLEPSRTQIEDHRSANCSERPGEWVRRVIISLLGLQTDTPASINYPVGTMTITLNGPAGVTTVVTITTDGTVNAHISVTDIGSLSFTLNLDTLTLTQN